MLKRLRTRIILTYTVIVLLGFGGLALVVGRQIRSSSEADFNSYVEGQVELIAQSLASPMEHFLEGETSSETLQSLIQSYVDDSGGRILILNHDGEVWIDSAGLVPSGTVVDGSVIQAARENRIITEPRIDESGQRVIYGAAPLHEEGRVFAIVLLAQPTNEVDQNIAQRWSALLGLTGGLTLLTVIVSALVAASLTRPLNQLRQAAHRIGEGEFSATVQNPGTDEIGELARAFNSMSEKVEAMLDQQRSFASNAAHELRTPLTTMLLRTESLVENGCEGEQTNQYLIEIDSEARRLSGLVDDLLLLSRLDAGQLKRGEERVDIGRLARSLLRSYQPQLERKSLTCNLQVAEDLPPVTGQMSHLHLVFRNLLDNAIKYTPAGGSITWSISCEGDTLVSRVEDTGRGISSEQRDHLFERFYRADASRSRSVPGTGLGLSLTASVVELYGGQIVVHSPGLNRGTEVVIRWPCQAQAEGQ